MDAHRTAEHADRAPQFRADADPSGRWFVWESVGSSGWATVVSCPTRLDAVRLAEQLNSGPRSGEVHDGVGGLGRPPIADVIVDPLGRVSRLA